MSYVKPDRIYTVPITGGELRISPSMDFLHYFQPMGAWILKYVDMESEPPRICNVILGGPAADFLMKECGIECLSRESMGQQEHDQWIEWASSQLTDEDFGVIFDEDVPIQPELDLE